MTSPRICPQCEAKLSDLSLEGLCPGCIAGLALNTGTSDASGQRLPDLPARRETGCLVGDHEVLEEIGRRRPDAAVVMMTAYWAAGALEQARRLGARALLAKPVDLDQVAAAVDEALHTPLRGDARC